MHVLLLGATGMVGQGALRECLLDPEIDRVTVLARSSTGQRHSKLRELIHSNLLDLAPIAEQLSGFDACLYCLGISAVGLSEAEYTRVTYDIALSVANTLLERNPQMTFVFVSGGGADSTESGRVMWARVKGRTENALLRLPFKAVYVIRPGIIIPLHGVRSKTRAYNVIYTILRPLYPILRITAPSWVTTTERLGRAMIKLAKLGFTKRVIEPIDINRI